MITSYISKTARLQSVEDKLVDRDIALQILKENLVKAQDRMKKLGDKSKTDREFVEGDMMFLRLQPYMQISVGGKRSQKLSPLFYGPYKVMQRAGSVAYKSYPRELGFILCFMYLSLGRNWGRQCKCNINYPLIL